MYPQPQANRLRIILTIIAVLFVVVIVWLVASYGFLNIEGASKDRSAIYTRVEQNLVKVGSGSATGSTTPLTSDSYSVTSRMKDGDGVYVSQIDVPRFLMGVSAPTETIEAPTTVLARNAFSSVALIGKQVITYEQANRRIAEPASFTSETTRDVIDRNFPEFVTYTQIDASHIGGITRTTKGYQPLIYSLASKKETYFPSIEGTEGEVYLSRTAKGFSVYNVENSKTSTYSLGEKPRSLTAQLNAPIATYSGAPVYAYQGNTLVIVTGGSVVEGGDADQDESNLANDTVIISDATTGQEQSRIDLGQAAITQVHLSADEKYLAIIGQDSTAIYDTSSGQREFAIGYAIDGFLWGDGDMFVYTTLSSGVFRGTVASRQSSTVVPYTTVRPTKLSFIKGGVLYFSGFSGAITRAQSPDAYTANLSENTTPAKQQVIRKTPEQGEGYYVDVINNTPIVLMTRYISGSTSYVDEPTKRKALHYIKDILHLDPAKTRFVYNDLSLN